MAATRELSSVGYVEEEYFIAGDAASYELTSEATPDGMWTVEPAETAPYTSRMIVRRPASADEFSGTVVVEWLNVSVGRDFDGDWNYLVGELIREGHAYVGVSAQMIGVEHLAASDAERYGELDHPGDQYSWDVFTQAAAALLTPEGPAPLADLVPDHLIAAGFSQSAGMLMTYVDAIQPLVDIYDGFFLHDGGQPIEPNLGPTSEPAIVRSDLRSPVLIFLTEFGTANTPVHQEDSDTVLTWEVAGTAHVDRHLIDESGIAQNPETAAIVDCGGAMISDGPQHQVANAALHHLVAWVDGGPPPPVAPRIDVTDVGTPVIERDAHGIALGGVRTPLVDVPIATLTAEPASNGPGPTCFASGATIPFDAATLATLYPTQADYITAFTESADAAVAAGFLLRPDADDMIAEAREVTLD